MPGRPGFGGPGPRIGVPAEKTRDFKGSLKRLAGQLRPELGIITIVVIFSIASVAFTISGPKMLGKATNEVFRGISGKQIGKLLPGATKEQAASALRAQGNDNLASMLESMDVVPGEGIDFSRLHRTLGFVALIYAFATLFGWAQNYCMAGVAQRVVYSLRKQVDEKLDRLPLKYFDDNPRGDILSRVTNDIDNIAQTLQQSLTQIITSVLMIVGVLAQMFSISPLLAGISLLVIPISMIVTSAIAKRSQKQFTAQWERTGRLNGNIEEMHSGHSIVKVFGRQREAIEVFNQQNQELFDSSFHAQFISGLIQPSMNFINNLNYVMIAVIGGMRVANGGLSLGSVQAFIQYSKQFQQPIMQTASIANILQSTIASAERVFELLDESEEVPDPADPVRLEGVAGHVMLDNVSFRYDPDTPLIRDLSLEARPGATIAIVGPTGAGKTTLVNLLMRFYEIDSGSITIDGIDIRNMTRDDLRRTFGMVLQDTWLFGGTIKENIAYGRDDATDEDVRVAATAAHVDHFVRTLPDGYNTPLTDDATNISAGERQLLTIARAFLADPEILILDEATSSVDTRTEVLIQRAMAELMKGRTSFVIAHRLSTIRDADTIIVVNDGCIVEQGTHKGLLGAKGFYSGLYNSQFADAQFAGDGFADAQFAGAQFASTAKK
ncbi:MAG: ABC transporter ATP-binding protein/permease [Coriobacteriia bacterium]|nr:ABC transporter ATP-binding protein/permease [Coriobacteriia bacterium]